ncbi:unnamed protein product [Callosobruchus maculatus]|uniref:Uncharacterized protein n=1 Tax=Callosobruchus maculatus TaxID=64391 RepID=A0A653DFR0_CALMS|nr:unnamed protein product [Callosobruchus maculatus]
MKNESNDFNRQSNLRHTISTNDPSELRQTRPITKQMEDRYAQMHIREFNQIKNNFENHKTPEKPARANNPGTITYRRFEPKYTDVSSSASTLTSEGTFGENVSTKPDLKLVQSNAIIPINSERPLPNPYQFGRNSEEVYAHERNSTASSDSKLKRSPSIEVSKLKLPPNRDVVTLSRVKSPISHDYNNTDKEIATELLKPKRSPTPNQNVKSLSPTHKAFTSSVDYPESLRNLSTSNGTSQQNSSSSVGYRDNIFEDRRSESFPQNMQTFSPIACNRDGIYEKVVNEALTPANEEDKRGAFSAINNNLHDKRSPESPSPVHIEDRRSKFLSSPIQNYPSPSDKENSYEKRMIGHLSPSRQMFKSLNTTKKYRNEDTRNDSSSPYDQSPQNQNSSNNTSESLGATHRMFSSHNSQRDSPRNEFGTPVSSPDHDQVQRRDPYGSPRMPSSTLQASMDYPDNVEQNNANRDVEPRYSSRFQNMQNQSISRNESPQFSSGFQNKERANMDKDERCSSPAESQRSSRFSENQSNPRTSEQDLWKYRQSTTHSPGSHHSSPTSGQVGQTLERQEIAEDDVQIRKMTSTEARNAFQAQQNSPRNPDTEYVSPGNHNMMTENRMNPNMYRNNQPVPNQRLRPEEQLQRLQINPNEFRHTYDNNQNKNLQSGGGRTQNLDMYPPQNTTYNNQTDDQSVYHQIRQHRNIPSQTMRHSPQSGPFPPQDLRRRPPEPQRQVFFPPESPNYGVYKNVPPPANLVRSSTPNNLTQPPLKQVSPQKEELRKSVEAYYWKEIKKLKEQENMELYYCQMNMVPYFGYAEDPGSIRRSRSMLPTNDRNSRRSLSLPRNVPNDSSKEPVMLRQHPVLQQKPVIYQNEPLYGQHFKRNTPERRTIDGSDRTSSIYRPIFKRGSLTTPVKQQDDPQYKKVSFRHFEENLPRRQVGQNCAGPRNTNVQYPARYSVNINEGVYGNPNELYPRYVPQIQQNRWPNIPEQELQNAAPRGVTRHGSMQLQEGIYDRRPPLARKPPHDSNYARRGADMPKREIIMGDNEIFGQFGGYVHKEEPSYSGSVISNQESIYGQSRGPKQIIVSDKVCDMYGQIHDRNSPSVVRRSGVMMGRLQPQHLPQAPTSQPLETPDFLQRNSRLTSSANDIRSGRYPNRIQQQNPHALYKEGIYSDYPPSRPLPPVPIDARGSQKYDPSRGAKEHRSRSGSTGSAVKPKKKGFFGE